MGTQKNRRWQRLAWIGLLVFMGLAAFAYRYSTFRITKNFYAVEEGKFYRSAQLTPVELDEAIQKYGIKTVISVRGAPEHAAWYGPEVQVIEKNQARFEGIWWTAEHFPPKEEFLKFENILATGEYPMLIHCRTGADRTGLGAAIYEIEKMGTPRDLAIQRQLSFKNWHVQAFKPAMIEFAKRYQGVEWAKAFDGCAEENRPWMEHVECPARSSGP